MYKNGELFRRIMDERTDGLPSVGFLDADTESLESNVTLAEKDRDLNDEISVPSPCNGNKRRATSKFGLV